MVVKLACKQAHYLDLFIGLVSLRGRSGTGLAFAFQIGFCIGVSLLYFLYHECITFFETWMEEEDKGTRKGKTVMLDPIAVWKIGKELERAESVGQLDTWWID